MSLDRITMLFVLLGFVLFYKEKTLKNKTIQEKQTLSIIIPARNEEINLPTLLSGLEKEKDLITELIVVNDGSDDATAKIAKSFDAKVINLDHKPQGWGGKNFACFTGAKVASGEVLLFLDADLIPQKNMIKKLESNYRRGTVLSVQPYHYTKKAYEQFSLFFNAVAIAAVGVCFPGKKKSIGLFGPVLMLDKNLYFGFGGHTLVKNEILEDFHLGTLLRKRGIECDMFLGYGSISYQMYKGGIMDLIWGWSKNFASGAIKTPIGYLLPVVLWLISYYTIVIELIKNSVFYFKGSGSLAVFLLWLTMYIVSGILLLIKVKKLGKFSFLSYICYVIPLAGFTLIFIFSLILKFIVKRVKWKGRWHNV